MAERRGIASANQILVGLYEKLCEKFPGVSGLALSRNNTFIVFGPKAAFDLQDPITKIGKVIDDIQREKPSYPNIHSGVFEMEAWKSRKRSTTLGDPTEMFATEAAMIALEYAKATDRRVAIFDSLALGEVLQTRFKYATPEVATGQYESIKRAGIETPMMNHSLANVLLGANDAPGAEKLWARNVEIDGSHPPWQLHLGFALYMQGKNDEAARSFKRGADLDKEKSRLDWYAVQRGLSYARAASAGWTEASDREIAEALGRSAKRITELKLKVSPARREELNLFYEKYGIPDRLPAG